MLQKMSCKAFTTTIIIGLIMSLTAVLAVADTPVGGPIFEDTTWTKEGSPYIVTAGVLVEEGVTLTIEPGVVVKFNYGKALQIDGCLIAQGTEDEPIIFTSNQPSPAPGDWGYILFTDTSVDATYDDEGNYTGGSIMQYCVVEYAGQSNPAVRVETSSPFVDYCIIKNNASIGVSSSNSSLFKITNCTISDNLGNGIYVSGSVLIVSGSTVSNNSASGSGGGIYASGTVTISSNTITNNSASGSGYIYGGGVYASGTATISDNTIANNSASCTAGGGWGGLDKDGWGGGIYASGNFTITISGNTITNNSASGVGLGWGGGIYLRYNVTIKDNIITNNSSSGYGGGICYYDSYGSANTIISGNNISNNSAPIGGGIYSYTNQAATITHNTIVGNFISEGDGKAGGIYIFRQPTINHNNIYANIPYDIYNSNSQGSPDIDATNNWWGTDKSSEILEKIYDWYDDSMLGKVDFTPYLLTPPGAPAPPEGLMITVADSTVTLNWAANPEPDLAGYKVYYGQSEGGPYDGTGAAEGDSPIDVGDVTTATLSGLPVDSATYYFVVTAYDTEDNESYFSNEFSNNTTPQTPTNQSPADGAENIALSPTLEADAFFDDDGDGHAASQWQVDVEGGSFNTVYDSGEDAVNLTSITLPITLERMTTYKWRVRYLDGRGRWSDYSTPTFFTTRCQLHPTGDVSGDNTVSAYDAALILQYVVGLIDEFPVDSMASPIDSTPRDYTVSVPKQSVKAGDRILMPISIDDATGLLGGGISLRYDPTVLKAVDFTAPSLLNGFYWKANIALIGEIRFAFASAEPAQGKGNLLMVEFEVMPNTEGRTTPLILAGINLSNSLTIKRINGAVTILPDKTALLPNFPNPFNPETWIPYKLAQSANVAIQIYDVKGRLVRTLNLSNQSAGVYVTKHTAAYWNGRDDAGEKVASGVYFYILQVEHPNKDGTGKFRAMRKMAIMK